MAEGRYAKFEMLDWWSQEIVSNARAIVVGCGALGNEVAKNLALVGWSQIVLVDHDSIELSNLTRSVFFRPEHVGQSKSLVLAKSLKGLNGDSYCIPLDGRVEDVVSEGLVSRSDVILGCVDNVAARMSIGRLAAHAGTMHIDGGLGVWEGTVAAFPAGDGPCYSCGLGADDLKDIALRRSCPMYAARAASHAGLATTPTLASIVGATTAQLALQWVHTAGGAPGSDFPTGRQLRFDARFHRFWNSRRTANPDCFHPTVACKPDPIFSPNWISSWRSILEEARSHFGAPPLTLRVTTPLQIPGRNPDSPVRDISGDEDWLHLSPQATAVPPWAWIRAHDHGEEYLFELAGCPEHLSAMQSGCRA